MLRRFVVAAVLAASPGLAPAQTVHVLKNQPPDSAIMTFQLTDGRVLAQGGGESDFWILTPDSSGSYVNGTWKQAASLPVGYQPYAMASRVLADGRVLIEGGEYNFNNYAFTNLGAVYDPVKDAWTSVKHPRGWTNIGDSPSAVMPDGTFFLGDKLFKKFASLDPKTMTWTEVTTKGKNDFNAEEGWTLMPDGSIVTLDVKDNPNTERYVPKRAKWQNLGATPVNLQGPPCCGCINVPPKNFCYYPPGEIGPAILRPDGTVFATGATHSGESNAHTAIYTPGSGWTAGPDFPNQDQAGDDYASLLPNGHVLVEGNSGTLYEWDGTNLKSEPVNAGGSLMVLPTGEILVGGYETYTSSGTYESAWQPTITSSPSSVTRGSTYQISGTQFNGLSQANSFGDEFDQSTNYPLVRITNNGTGHVFYTRTHDHSTMGVATGNQTVSTNFDVPSNLETGASSLVVVANGIPSSSVAVTVQ
ncbi:MAG TPA: hypothetical protein VGI20_11125 [Rhizomicrobium sp.]|jgi:hypothetical protein